MELQIFSICKTKDKHLLAIEQEYLKRFPKRHALTISELGGEKFQKHPAGEQKVKQSDLLKKITLPEKDIVLLDEGGEHFSTEQLSKWLTEQGERGINRLGFAIGGPLGWSEEAKERSKKLLSLSKLTMPYQLVRVLLVEQLYRCHTIATNLPYHK